MRYYAKRPNTNEIQGPFAVEELNRKLTDGTIGSEWLVTSDTGEPRERVAKSPARDWFHLSRVPGVLGFEKKPEEHQPYDADYELLPDGRKHFVRATAVDVIVSIFLPGCGVLVGALAYFRKGEQKRGVTMIIIGAAIIFLLVIIRSR